MYLCHPLYPLRYADYLSAVYANRPVAKADKWPPTPSTVYIKLALVKKERVSRAEADEFTRLTLQGNIDTILQAKEQIEMDDILNGGNKTRFVVVEGAPGIGKNTFVWELCRQWPTLAFLTSSAPQTARGGSADSHTHHCTLVPQ